MNARVSLWLAAVAFVAALASPATASAQAQPKAKTKVKPPVTTIYLVRHAEKDTANPADPALSPAGAARALALRQTLVKRGPVAIFTTDTKRTRTTVAPLAEALKLEPQVYDPRRGHDLADRIEKEYHGKTVVVVGHSNTLLPFIDDFGATRPVEEIADNEYDYLFTVRLVDGATPTVDVRGYGAERKGKAAAKPSAQATPMK
ncbi:MAG TPA: histidine phosphatase family protein [Hymenobacter sp.]|jgi:phosphohistidine phosphatase SixA|uniref:histidine phosphatase family protein n=1 Tax=Hymenobacter sp. TaxID=1898978 RepID=UPI002ED903BE